MIVRDEADSIRRCIESVTPYITRWAIIDTGSVDNTEAVARTALARWPGQWISVKWQGDFALHRNQALDLARSISTSSESYVLLIDADEVLEVDCAEAFISHIKASRVISWWAEDGDWRYRKIGLIRIADAIEWRGSVHEHLAITASCAAISQIVCEFAHVIYGHYGFRRRNAVATAEADLRLLARAIDGHEHAEDYRTSFYLARTSEVAMDFGNALVHFRNAARQARFDDDKWQALWGLGRVLLQQDNLAEAATAFVAALVVAPTRAEALVHLSNIALTLKQFPEAQTLAYEALSKAEPNETSMYDRSAYGWRAVDALCVSAFALDDRQALNDALFCYDELLRKRRVPHGEIARVEKNIAQINCALAR